LPYQALTLLAIFSLCCICVAEIDAAEEAGDAAKAEQLRKARRAELIRKLRQLQRRAARPKGQKGGCGGGAKMSRAEVGEPDVARIISAWTGGGTAGDADINTCCKKQKEHFVSNETSSAWTSGHVNIAAAAAAPRCWPQGPDGWWRWWRKDEPR
jgi:hypothetical protein